MNGVRFGNLHSYDDFGMILKSKTIPVPQPKTSIIEIPGADGCLDLSTALTGGKVKFNNRNLQFVFTLIGKNCEAKKSEITNAIQGNVFEIIVDTDPCFYYVGRCNITSFEQGVATAELIIECDCKPYKYNTQETQLEWSVETEKAVEVECGRMEVVPRITVSENMQCEFKGGIYSLTIGANTILDIQLEQGANTLKFIGTGNVKLTFRGGSL